MTFVFSRAFLTCLHTGVEEEQAQPGGILPAAAPAAARLQVEVPHGLRHAHVARRLQHRAHEGLLHAPRCVVHSRLLQCACARDEVVHGCEGVYGGLRACAAWVL